MSLPGFTAAAALPGVADQHYIRSAPAAVKLSSIQGIVPQNIPPTDDDPPPSPAENTNCDISVRCIGGRQYWTVDCPGGAGDNYGGGRCFLPATPHVGSGLSPRAGIWTRSIVVFAHEGYGRLCPC
jgi:hypothetical protein